MYGNIIEDIRDIMTDYFVHWDGTLKPIKHDGRRSEFEFRIELEDGLWFTGRIDTVGKAKGMRWLVEHKTRSEEHTSELQSLMRISYAVFCLKKKTRTTQKN